MSHHPFNSVIKIYFIFRSPVHSSSVELQNICNERDSNFERLRETYFNEDGEKRVGLSDSDLWRRISNFQSDRKGSGGSGESCQVERHTNDVDGDDDSDDVAICGVGDDIYELVRRAYEDHNVWAKMELLCNQFLKQTSAPTLAVLLSIL